MRKKNTFYYRLQLYFKYAFYLLVSQPYKFKKSIELQSIELKK